MALKSTISRNAAYGKKIIEKLHWDGTTSLYHIHRSYRLNQPRGQFTEKFQQIESVKFLYDFIFMICFVFISTTYIFGTLLTANGNLKTLNHGNSMPRASKAKNTAELTHWAGRSQERTRQLCLEQKL